MPAILTTAEIRMSSGLDEDSAVLSFVSTGAAIPAPGYTGPWTNPVSNFLNGIWQFMSNKCMVGPGGIRYKLYNLDGHLDGSPHGSPVAIDSHTTPNTNLSAPLPSEVAMVLTLRGQGWDGAPVEAPDSNDPGFELDRPRQRKTGRLYLGPLGTDSLAATGRPVDAFMFTARAEAAAAVNQYQAAGLSWSVWSRKNETTVPIVAVQTDDAFDTQRRRGLAPLSRVTTLTP